MGHALNPVEQRLQLLSELWNEATQDSRIRLIVWRIPANADRLLAAFFAASQHSEAALTPDYFLRFEEDFDTGFGYSRSLQAALRSGYADSLDKLRAQGAATAWPEADVRYPLSASGVLQQFEAFARYYREHMRFFVPVLTPGTVSSAEALQRWLDVALRAPAPQGVCLCIVDHAETRQWQALVDAHPATTRIIDAPIDMFDVARETAAQTGNAGAQSVYRQMLTDVMTLLDRGTAQQTSARAQQALKLAERQQWLDQQVVLHMAVAGAYLKEKQCTDAVASYREARRCAEQAEAAQHPSASLLVVQSWFGEAGAWLTDGQPQRASESYAKGADVARRIPHGMFALEGLRMAGFCLAQADQREPARERYAQALREAEGMAPTDLPMTTLPLLLQDMLRLQDPRRTEKLEQAAQQYQAETTKALLEAEKQSSALGQRPTAQALESIEFALHAQMRSAFAHAGRARETLIAGGDDAFRKIVATGRRLLQPAWSGLPDIRHPLDEDESGHESTWSEPPQFMPLPDPEEQVT